MYLRIRKVHGSTIIWVERFMTYSVLFDQGKIFAVYGYDEVHCIRNKTNFSGYVKGKETFV